MKLSFLLAFLVLLTKTTNGYQLESNIDIGRSSCTSELLNAVDKDLSKQRQREGLPRLTTSPQLMASAKEWANARGVRNGPYHSVGTFENGEYVTSQNEESTSGFEDPKMSLVSFDIFREDWKNLGEKPWYGGDKIKRRRFTSEEWAKTDRYGVGCSTWNEQNRNYFRLVIHFRYPKELFQAYVGTDICPPGLINKTLTSFNELRKKFGFYPLVLTSQMTASATREASLHPVPITFIGNNPYNKIAGQYAVYTDQQVASKIVDIRGLDNYGGRMGSQAGNPLYRGDTKYGRFFNMVEWAKTSEVGVACSTYLLGNDIGRFLLVVHFKYPGARKNILRPCENEFYC